MIINQTDKIILKTLKGNIDGTEFKLNNLFGFFNRTLKGNYGNQRVNIKYSQPQGIFNRKFNLSGSIGNKEIKLSADNKTSVKEIKGTYGDNDLKFKMDTFRSNDIRVTGSYLDKKLDLYFDNSTKSKFVLDGKNELPDELFPVIYTILKDEIDFRKTMAIGHAAMSRKGLK